MILEFFVIYNGIMKTYLAKHSAEVKNMLITEAVFVPKLIAELN